MKKVKEPYVRFLSIMEPLNTNLVNFERIEPSGERSFQVRIILDFTDLSLQKMEKLTSLLGKRGFEVIRIYGGRDDPEYKSGNPLIKKFISIFPGLHGKGDLEDSPDLGHPKNRTIKEAFPVIYNVLAENGYRLVVLQSALSTLSGIEVEYKHVGNPDLIYPELAGYKDLIKDLKRYLPKSDEKHQKEAPKENPTKIETKTLDAEKEKRLTEAYLRSEYPESDYWTCCNAYIRIGQVCGKCSRMKCPVPSCGRIIENPTKGDHNCS
jgi:hypothetical protein